MAILFTQTAQKSVSNTVTETTLIGGGVGTLTLPAYFWVPGRAVKIKFGGTLASTANPTALIKLKIGSTVLCATAAQALPNMDGSCEFSGEATIVCRDKYDELARTGGTLMSDMDIKFGVDADGGAVNDLVAAPTSATSFDTTSSGTINLTITWGTADAANTAVVEVLTIES